MELPPALIEQGNEQDFRLIGNFLRIAIQDVATEIGGDELVQQIEPFMSRDSILPDVEALMLLESTLPGSAKLASDRMDPLYNGKVRSYQTEHYKALRREVRSRRRQAFLGGLARGFSFGIVRPVSKKR